MAEEPQHNAKFLCGFYTLSHYLSHPPILSHTKSILRRLYEHFGCCYYRSVDVGQAGGRTTLLSTTMSTLWETRERDARPKLHASSGPLLYFGARSVCHRKPNLLSTATRLLWGICNTKIRLHFYAVTGCAKL